MKTSRRLVAPQERELLLKKKERMTPDSESFGLDQRRTFFVHFIAPSAYIEKKMFAEAIAKAPKARQLSGPANAHPVGFLGYAWAKSGRIVEARVELQNY